MDNEENSTSAAPTPLLTPHKGTPNIISTDVEFEDAISQLESGFGPFAIDAERASGYKYSARAYLIQIKRSDGGLHLIDPIAFPTDVPGNVHPLFIRLNEILQTDEVILHASTQDLPCLREVGLQPTKLFDTELAGRLAGLPRVGLGALVESLLNISLAKEHSAVDWSIRPLPLAWLTYAALDVELLVELKEKISLILLEQNKLDWAREEFEAILSAPSSEKRKDPWRRTSGMHRIKKRNVLAIIRSLWLSRDKLAQELDVAPSKLLTDAAIIELAINAPTNKRECEKVLRPMGARSRWLENSKVWLDAIELGVALPESEWPELRANGESMPPMKLWREKYPAKYAPLSHARFAIESESDRLNLPPENLASPEIIRKICWNPPASSTEVLNVDLVHAALLSLGARRWQSDIVAPLVAAALLEKKAREVPPVGPNDESGPDTDITNEV